MRYAWLLIGLILASDALPQASPGGNAYVPTQIIAGSGISVSPTSGLGKVTVSATGGGGTGTVTSVAFADASTTPIFTIGGSGCTTACSITETLSTESANAIFAGPTSGGAAQPTFRSLVNADLPAIPTTDLTGTLQAAQFPALTGDVTTPGASLAATIAAGAVTLAKQANLAANSIQGNNTGSPATPIALTAAQTKTLLAIANTDVSGLGTFSTGNAATPPVIGNTTPAAGTFNPLTVSGFATSATALTITEPNSFTGSAILINSGTGLNTLLDFAIQSNGTTEFSVSGAGVVTGVKFTVTGGTCSTAVAALVNVSSTSITECGGTTASSVAASATFQSVPLVSGAGSTKFTVSGCGTIATSTGGGAAGQFTCATGASPATLTFTINGATGSTAPNGWSCHASDITSGIDLPETTGGSATTAVVKGNVATSDVVKFFCIGY